MSFPGLLTQPALSFPALEVRGLSRILVNYGPGYRVYYVERHGVTYILLCGGDKSSQQRDIETALDLATKV